MISSPAHGAIVDGDDLFITTESFDGDEENYSVVANPSCRTRSVAFGFAPSDLAKSGMQEKVTGSENKSNQQLVQGTLKVKKMLRRVRKLPLTLRQKSFLFKSSTNTVAEYEEMDENGFGLEEAEEKYMTSPSDAQTIASLRSSRNNVRTGMSMLVRQTALVMNRPSKAYFNKESLTPSESPKSNSDPKNYRSMMLRDKSLILDDCSIGGMSDITEDASVAYAFPMNIHTSFRRTPMFINANTYRINEDEDESDSDNEDIANEPIEEEEEEYDSNDDVPKRERVYDFRTLSPLNDDGDSSVIDSRFRARAESEETAIRSNAHGYTRRRVCSDSEIESETLEMNLLSLTPASRSKNKNNRRSLGNSSNSKSNNEAIGTTQRRKSNPYAAWPFPRTRTHSDSYVDQKRNDNSTQMQSNRDDDLIPDAILFANSSRRQSLPLYQTNDASSPYRSTLRTRTFSDSVVHEKSVDGDIIWDPRNVSLLDTESPMAFQTQTLRQEIVEPSNTKSTTDRRKDTATSSVLATLSPTTDIRVAQRPLMARNPSPRTLNAANKIAAALLPAPAKILPAVPSPSARRSADQYYWGNGKEANTTHGGQEMELKDLCSWSSDSYDDIL